jgi:hypothetical protein
MPNWEELARYHAITVQTLTRRVDIAEATVRKYESMTVAEFAEFAAKRDAERERHGANVQAWYDKHTGGYITGGV